MEHALNWSVWTSPRPLWQWAQRVEIKATTMISMTMMTTPTGLNQALCFTTRPKRIFAGSVSRQHKAGEQVTTTSARYRLKLSIKCHKGSSASGYGITQRPSFPVASFRRTEAFSHVLLHLHRYRLLWLFYDGRGGGRESKGSDLWCPRGFQNLACRRRHKMFMFWKCVCGRGVRGQTAPGSNSWFLRQK